MADAGELRRDRLSRLVAARRKDLGLSVSAAARAAGINRATWSALERGERDTEEYLYSGIERAIAWAAGSIGVILAGGDPRPLTVTREPILDVEAQLRKIRDNPERSRHLRTWAQSQLDQLAAIREADQAEAEERDRRAG